MQETRTLARSIVEDLGLSRSINSIVIEGIDSPWLEKALIKRRKGTLDVKTLVWKDNAFLYGRIYRLFLYIADVLDPAFLYDPRITPDEEKDPLIRDRYNQIWSLYVDSRMERLGIESFFDRTLRKNLFIDLETGLGWATAGKIFDALWKKESFTYPEIVDLSYHLEERFADEIEAQPADCLEKDIARCLHHPSAYTHIERLTSSAVAEKLNNLLSFAAYSCRDSLIVPCHYGIVVLFQNKVFLEMIPAGKVLVLSVLDPKTNRFETLEIDDATDMEEIHRNVRDRFELLSLHARNEFRR